MRHDHAGTHLTTQELKRADAAAQEAAAQDAADPLAGFAREFNLPLKQGWLRQTEVSAGFGVIF